MKFRKKPVVIEAIVMPTNNSSMHLGWLAGRYPGKIGWLLSPDGWRTPHRWMPYALDNGAFACWDEEAFVAMLENRDDIGREHPARRRESE